MFKVFRGMSDSFSAQSAAVLFILSALLLPMILLTANIFSAGFYVALFIIGQVALLYFFYHEEYGFMAWYAFIASVTGLCFMLVVVLLGRGLQMEYLGFLLFLGYCIGGLVFMLHKRTITQGRESEKKKAYNEFYELDDKDISDFREKDELGKLVHEFSIQPAPRKDEMNIDGAYDFDEIFKGKKPAAFTGDLAESSEDESWSEEKEVSEDQRKADSWVGVKDDGTEDYKIQLLRQRIEEERKPDEHSDKLPKDYPKFSDYFKTHHNYDEPKEAHAEELKKESPQVNFDQVKSDLEKIDTGVKKISDKIREIGEKAIKEGEEKKKKVVSVAVEKKAKPTEVFASNNGTKYHHDKACASLKRVHKRNIVLFKDHNEARKRGLKACGLCKK